MSQSNTADITTYMQTVGQQARAASRALAAANTGKKNSALMAIYDELKSAKADILAANKVDMDKGKKNNLDAALLDRLELNDARFDGMLQGLKDVAALPDPIGEVTDMTYQPSGIHLGKMRVPLGVVGMIYESRPNVTLEAASLALKSGNAIILRGGSEAFESNQAIAKCILKGLKKVDMSEHSVQVLETTDRAAVGELITMTDYVDVIVPRGGKGLIERISRDARVPVIKHLDGNCHTFIDSDADADIAIKVSVNAKTHRYGTCNTMETLLVDESIANELLPKVAEAIVKADDAMQLRLDEKSQAILNDNATLKGHLSAATSDDWDTEYLAPILAIKVVSGIDEAIEHINTHGSHHTDVIITDNYTKSQRFIREVDSASVMINASSRFADGFEYGLGAEIGISTDKIHARGPVGLEGLTSQKWIVYGHGETRT
ncbi:glutamate-5-semialdehyde dehydrogenase [Psychrobacter sp. ANT_WB68]|uniref:glutamate-5-semialdehyde dehydrogenase n=1 Tax=Psychrobacter sp. ANT_WB68 TaxID=2597355 RepID=UPI0011F1BE39|nr:glutamate-5-semialdehyde dehydrogenase [Psychrobacter sp. ANT_WB68]KAA0913719.1 glutamate-5-semialdehyde dehydrogenase [Psychrobacter sp. ANT_WB68]